MESDCKTGETNTFSTHRSLQSDLFTGKSELFIAGDSPLVERGDSLNEE